MSFGLSQRVIEQIQAVFSQHSEVDEVILYGSRAKGNYKVGSDIDLTMKGEGIDYSILSMINTALYELPIPYTVDVSIFSSISNPELIEHIERVGVLFYAKDGLLSG